MHQRLFGLRDERRTPQPPSARRAAWRCPDPQTSALAAAAIQHYLQALGSCPLPSAQEALHLARLARMGDHGAGERLFENHRQLVRQIACDCSERGLPLSALIEEGELGLLHAVEAFDPDSGCDFASYATWRIRSDIEFALHSRTRRIRLSLQAARRLYRYLSALRGLV